jgi:hypothetical protein
LEKRPPSDLIYFIGEFYSLRDTSDSDASSSCLIVAILFRAKLNSLFYEGTTVIVLLLVYYLVSCYVVDKFPKAGFPAGAFSFINILRVFRLMSCLFPKL